eukprot:c2387_g1_i1.p1 GENE.c2387_g1_i1~~c2387_g1_i1.p1  ORF type:complete len:213 (-),score=43.97 c2387_g1_i1:156-794(-)
MLTKSHNTLTSLSLVDCIKTNDHANCLARAMQHLEHIRILDLSENYLGVSRMRTIQNGISSMHQLTTLMMALNVLEAEGMKILCEALINGHVTQMAKLSLSENNIGPEGAKFLAVLMGTNYLARLTFLDLFGNRIGTAGAKYLAENIPKLTQLTHLDLDSNRLLPEGASALAHSLKQLPKLSSLNMEENGLGSSSRDEICSILANRNSRLSL